MGFSNESAIVVDGHGTLNFFQRGNGSQTLKIIQGSAESRGESCAIVNQQNHVWGNISLNVNGNLDITHYVRSYIDDAATIRFYPYQDEQRQHLSITGNLTGYTDILRTDREADMGFMFVENTTAHIDGNVDIRLKADVDSGIVYGVKNRALNESWMSIEPAASDITLGSTSSKVRLHDIEIISESDSGYSEAYGLLSTGKANESGTPVIRLKGDATIEGIRAITKASGDDAYSYAAGAEAQEDGAIIFERSAIIRDISATGGAEASAFALSAVNGGRIQVNPDEDATAVVQISNDLFSAGALPPDEEEEPDTQSAAANADEPAGDADADSEAGRLSQIDINLLTSDSFFKGLTLGAPEGTDGEDGIINLKLANGATWTVPANNTLHGTLTLDKGIVILGDDGAATQSARGAISDPGAVTLTVDKLAGDQGVFSMRVDKDRDLTDHLTVQEGEGSHLIRLRSTGSEPTQAALTSLVDVHAGDAKFALEGGRAEFGSYQYELAPDASGDVTDWKLVRAAADPDGPQPSGPALSNSAKAALSLGSLGAQAAQHLNSLSDLRKRLGEVRADAGTGLWVQAIGQKDRISGYAGTGFKQDSYRFNFGFDHAFGQWLLGANFKHASSDQKTAGGLAKGDSHSEGLNLYATWRAESGAYADFVLSADKNHQHLSTSMIDGTGVSGTYHNTGYGASVEVGHKLNLCEAWSLFAEPQAELAYYAAKGESFTLTNGMQVKQGTYESLTGRLGVVIGRSFKDAKGAERGQAALQLGWKGELAGNSRIAVNGEEFSERLMQNRVYYGFNGNMKLTDSLSVYGYLERESGSRYTKEIEAGVGLKYRF